MGVEQSSEWVRQSSLTVPLIGHLGCFQSAVLELSAFEQHLDVVGEAQGFVCSLCDHILLCAGPCAEQGFLMGLRLSAHCWRS